MKDVLWNSLIASLQTDQCVLVLGPDIPAAPKEITATGGSEAISLRDAFCQDLSKQLEEEGQTVNERLLFAVAQQYDDHPAFSTVNGPS